MGLQGTAKREPELVKARLLELYEMHAGSSSGVERELGISHRELHRVVTILGLRGEADRIRKRVRTRFRLPHWERKA